MRVQFVIAALSIAAAYACGDSTGDSSILGPGGSADGGGSIDAGTNTSTGGIDSGGNSQISDAGNNGTDAGNTNGTDAGNNGTDAGNTSVDAGVDAGACIKTTTANGNGHHNPGDDCLSCHTGTGSAPKWTVAGTLYTKATGGTAIGGATIELYDANDQKLDIVTSSNGNFYTATAVKLPLKSARASGCPNDQMMTASPSNASCNTAGCHDAAMRIHLP